MKFNHLKMDSPTHFHSNKVYLYITVVVQSYESNDASYFQNFWIQPQRKPWSKCYEMMNNIIYWNWTLSNLLQFKSKSACGYFSKFVENLWIILHCCTLDLWNFFFAPVPNKQVPIFVQHRFFWQIKTTSCQFQNSLAQLSSAQCTNLVHHVYMRPVLTKWAVSHHGII